MTRCLSLFGLVIFTLGVTALASIASPAATPSATPHDDDRTPAPPPVPRCPMLGYHAAFSLN